MPKGDREILKADPEDGTTPIANLLLEALAIAPLGSIKKSAVIALWRMTYGWTNGNGSRRTEATINLSKWGLMLNTHPVYAQGVLRELVNDHVINRRDLGKGKGYVYSMNTRVNEWLGGKVIPLLSSNPFTLPSSKTFTPNTSKTFTPLATNPLVLNKVLNKDINKLKENKEKGGYSGGKDRRDTGSHGVERVAKVRRSIGAPLH